VFSNSQKSGSGQSHAGKVKQQTHGHPVRIIEGERREHPSSVKTAICTFCFTFHHFRYSVCVCVCVRACVRVCVCEFIATVAAAAHNSKKCPREFGNRPYRRHLPGYAVSIFTIGRHMPPSKVFSPMGGSPLSYKFAPPQRHLDWFSHLCTAHSRAQQTDTQTCVEKGRVSAYAVHVGNIAQ